MKKKWSEYYEEKEKEAYDSLLVTYKELKQQYDYESNDFFFNNLTDHIIDLKRDHTKFVVDEQGLNYHCNYKRDLIDKFETFKLGFKNDKEIEGFYTRFVSDIIQVHLEKKKNLTSELVKREYNDPTFLDKATKPDIIEFLIKYEVLDSFLYNEKIKNFIKNLDPLEVIKSKVVSDKNNFNFMSIEELDDYFSILLIIKKTDGKPILEKKNYIKFIVRVYDYKDPQTCKPLPINWDEISYSRLRKFFRDFYKKCYPKEPKKSGLRKKYMTLLNHFEPLHDEPYKGENLLALRDLKKDIRDLF